MSIDRRTFLRIGGMGVVGIAFVPLLNGCEEQIITPLGENQTIAKTPFLTSPEDFFVQNGGEGSITQWSMPTYAAATDWKMDILRRLGAQTTKLGTVTYQDLMDAVAADPTLQTTILCTMQCILESPLRVTPTGFTGTAYWTGVPLKHFLDKVGVDYQNTKRFIFTGEDKYVSSLGIEDVTQATQQGRYEPILAYRMNGLPLTPEHGFPVRLIVHTMYGYRNIKWIKEIRTTVVTTDVGTYPEQGFTREEMAINSRGTSLRNDISIPSGTFEIRGFAIAGSSPVKEIIVTIDGQAPRKAEIVSLDELREVEQLPPNIRQIQENIEYPYSGVWVHWRLPWEATSGKHTITIQATDEAGNTQPPVLEDVTDGQNAIVRYNVNVS